MSTVASKPNKSVFEVDEASMRTNKVDQTSSLLLTLVLLIGLAVASLGILFFLKTLTWTSPPPMILAEETAAGRGDHAEGFERDFDPPGADEVEQLSEPAVEQSLQMVTDAVSSIAASMENIESTMNANSNGTGKGDSRPPGPEGEGADLVPRHERWEIKFTARDRRNYAIQLEAFKIELGAIGGGISSVDYVSNLVNAPTKRSGQSKQEKRLYFMSKTENVLLQYERQILQSAGVPNAGRQILKFVPDETANILAQAEAAYYQEKRKEPPKIANIAKTVYECRANPKGGGFTFVVIDQRYRIATGGKK